MLEAKHKPANTSLFTKIKKLDRVLITSLLLAFILCLHSIQWGWVECWNPDQMAFKTLFIVGKEPLNPGWFLKPPFHTYFNYFLSVLPLQLIESIFHLPPDLTSFIRLIWSRTLTSFLFLGSITLVFLITKSFFDPFSARIIAVIFATSAGFIAFSHFLTTDIPVTFWTLFAFYWMRNILFGGSYIDYSLAGFLTGLATATKYNGLGVGIGLVAAHILSFNSFRFKQIFLSRKLVLGLSMVPIGFFVGNPFALLDQSTFIADFMYNNVVTPAFNGVTSGHSYWKFILSLPEVIGSISWITFLFGFLFSIYFVFKPNEASIEKKAVILLLTVFLLYYYAIGSFPRLPVRFIVPIVPFFLMISGPFWVKLKPYKRVFPVLLVLIISYNLICSVYVGKRFLEDPRMIAIEWVKENIPAGSSVEYSLYTPEWNQILNMNLDAKEMPYVTGRKRMFKAIFKDNIWVTNSLDRLEQGDEQEQWYTFEQLMVRRPDYVAINSGYYDRFFSIRGEFYPSIRRFFKKLINEKYPYTIVFKEENENSPRWIYPKRIDSLTNTMIILARNDLALSK